MMEITQKAPTVMIMMSFIIIIITVVDNVGFLIVDGAPWEAAAISGEEEGENNGGLVLEKFRSLLGLTSFHKVRQSNVYYSPAPSPSEAEAPGPARAPTPGPMAHLHHRHRRPQPRPMFALHKFGDHKRVNAKKNIVITGVVVSIGVASVLCALGILILLAFSRRKNKHKKRATVIASLCDDDKFINASPGFALVLEHKCISASTVENKSCELDVSKEQGGFRDRHSSSAEEIISVHEYAESCKYESDGQNSPNCDNSDGNDPHLSEDESFHSLIDSRSSSNRRLSNVSLCSFGDPLEVFSPDQINKSPISSKIINTQSFVNLSSKHPPLPPPPPPPPPPHSKTTKMASQSSKCPKIQEVRSNIPPPPPFLNGNGNSIKGPPPPPGQPFLSTPMGKDGAPLPKLKPLHWDKVRAAPDQSMVWDQLRCSSFEFDEQMIESLFGYSLKTAFNDETKSKPPSPSTHVLEPKRLQNITILSKALNASAEKVCEALVQGEGLCTTQLEALVKMTPTKEEEVKLSDYMGDINELGSAEKLVKQMLRIPYVFQRIEAMLYKATFDDEVVHLRNSFSMLEEACKELRSSRLFLKLLEAVLKTGNRMNVGTIRGGAKAFKLDALLKLADVKGTDGKTTLLHFVVQEIIRSEGIRMSNSIMGQIERNNKSRTIEEQEEDYRRMGLDLVSGLSNELCNVKRTASIDLEVLATSVSNLSEGISKLQKLVSKDMCKDATDDNFVHAMMTFLSHAEKNLKELRAEEDKVLLSVREITEYYHGNISKDEKNPLWIYVIVSEFLVMLDQVCRELKSLKTPRTPNPLAPFR